MQEMNEKLSLNVSSIDGVVSQNSVIPRGLLAPYQQQKHDINLMLQNNMTIELHKQLLLLEQRSIFCMRVKDQTLEEVMRRSREMEIRLRKALAETLAEASRRSGEMEIRLKKALAEAEFWKKEAGKKTELAENVAKRLLNVKRREMLSRTNPEKKYVEDAQSSIGDNGGDDVDTANTRSSKRRRR